MPDEFWGSHCADGCQVICLLCGKSRCLFPQLTLQSQGRVTLFLLTSLTSRLSLPLGLGVADGTQLWDASDLAGIRGRHKGQLESQWLPWRHGSKHLGWYPDTLPRSHLGQTSCFSLDLHAYSPLWLQLPQTEMIL